MGISQKQTKRPIYQIAEEIRKDWGAKMYFGAVPYVQAMNHISDIGEEPVPFVHDGGRDTVARFLCNAGTWRGETARRIKAELKAMLK